MNKIWPLVILACITGQNIFAAPFRAQCNSAGGFYGAAKVLEDSANTLVEVHDGLQLKLGKILKDLGSIPPKKDAYHFKLTLPSGSCKVSKTDARVGLCFAKNVDGEFNRGEKLNLDSFRIEFQKKEISQVNGTNTFIEVIVTVGAGENHLQTNQLFLLKSKRSYDACSTL